MLGERLTNALCDCTSLPRERNGSCISSKNIENKYDEIERAEDGEHEREDEDCERQDGGHERQKVSDDVIHRRKKYIMAEYNEKCIIEAYIRV